MLTHREFWPKVYGCWLAWWPVVVVHLCYLLSIQAGDAPACLPWIEGCTSISRAAREGWANLLFKLCMLPYAALLAAWWLITDRWCQGLALGFHRTRLAMRGSGLVAAAFLALYVCFLGVDGPTYAWLRRYGINLYFAGSVLAQMLLLRQLSVCAIVPHWQRRLWLLQCALLLGLGLASLPLQFWVEDRKALLNALEWQYSALMVAAYPLAGWAWASTGLSLRGLLARGSQ